MTESIEESKIPSRSEIQVPTVHFPTLAAAATVALFFWGLSVNAQNETNSRMAIMALRLEELPTRDQFGAEIDRVGELQKARMESEAARLQALADRMETFDRHAQQINETLARRVESLDVRIANLGMDHSRAMIDFLREGQSLQTSNAGEAGGPYEPIDPDEIAYADYALRLVLRDTDMNTAQARSFVDRAFQNPRGQEARRLIELAAAARSNSRGVVSD